MSRRCLLLAALLALPQFPRVHGQAPTWNDKTFDTAVDRRNDWCGLMARVNNGTLAMREVMRGRQVTICISQSCARLC